MQLNSLLFEKEIKELIQAFESFNNKKLESAFRLSVFEYEAYYKISLSFHASTCFRIYFKPLSPKELKLVIRQLGYDCLSRYFGHGLPYGLLLGIRPVKLLRSLIRGLKSEEPASLLMNKLYYVHPEMTARILSIYRTQLPYLDSKDQMPLSLYLCIAFCPSRCYYCSFPSNDINQKAALVRPYLEALKSEFRLKIEEGLRRDPAFLSKLDVLYIGGGTPSVLPVSDLEELLSYLGTYIDYSGLREFCFEAGRIDTLSPELFELLKKYKVSRLSINPQTMKPATLAALGRKHGPEDVAPAFETARSYGFHNINSDLILGLRGESIADMEESLDRLLKLGPQNITLHALSVKRGSDYALSLASHSEAKNAGMDANSLLAMQERMILRLCNEGYRPYYLYRQKLIAGGLDNIGFAKKSYECVYNIRIMEEEHEILGLGAGASSKIKEGDKHRNIRNPKDLEAYISRYADLS